MGEDGRIEVVADGTQDYVGASEGASADEVAALLSEYYDAVQREDAQAEARLSERLSGVEDAVTMLAQGLEDSSSGPDLDAVTVTLSDAQWDEVQESWLWAKSGVQVGLFLALVCTLLVAAVFGSHLWDAMARGWRR